MVRIALDSVRPKPDRAQFERLSKKYEFLLFARNLANAHNRVNAFEFIGVTTQVLQEPRTIGLTIRWNY